MLSASLNKIFPTLLLKLFTEYVYVCFSIQVDFFIGEGDDVTEETTERRSGFK